MNLKKKIFTIIFGTDTRDGKVFDVILLWLIILIVMVVVLESVKPLREVYHNLFMNMEWIFTITFTLEYLLRVYSSP